MHETGVVRDLIRRLEGLARDAGAAKVSGVIVRLGALSQFSPEHFRTHFDEETGGTLVEGAMLTIVTSQDASHPNAQDVMIESVDLDIRDEEE
jgi:hydrogenase nickel incorporation protein HypA/HybF